MLKMIEWWINIVQLRHLEPQVMIYDSKAKAEMFSEFYRNDDDYKLILSAERYFWEAESD